MMSSEKNAYAIKLFQLSERVLKQDSKMQKAYLFYCIDFGDYLDRFPCASLSVWNFLRLL